MSSHLRRPGSIPRGSPVEVLPAVKGDLPWRGRAEAGKGVADVIESPPKRGRGWHTTGTSRQAVLKLASWFAQQLEELQAHYTPQLLMCEDQKVSYVKACQGVYSTVVQDLVEQVSANCLERGNLLACVWSRFLSLFDSLTELMVSAKANYAHTTAVLESELQTMRYNYLTALAQLEECMKQRAEETARWNKVAEVHETQVTMLKNKIAGLQEDAVLKDQSHSHAAATINDQEETIRSLRRALHMKKDELHRSQLLVMDMQRTIEEAKEKEDELSAALKKLNVEKVNQEVQVESQVTSFVFPEIPVLAVDEEGEDPILSSSRRYAKKGSTASQGDRQKKLSRKKSIKQVSGISSTSTTSTVSSKRGSITKLKETTPPPGPLDQSPETNTALSPPADPQAPAHPSPLQLSPPVGFQAITPEDKHLREKLFEGPRPLTPDGQPEESAPSPTASSLFAWPGVPNRAWRQDGGLLDGPTPVDLFTTPPSHREAVHSEEGTGETVPAILPPDFRPFFSSCARMTATCRNKSHWLLPLLDKVTEDRLAADAEAKPNAEAIGAVEFVYKYFLNTFGDRRLCEVWLLDFFATCNAYCKTHPRVRLYSSFLGICGPPLSTDAYLAYLKYIDALAKRQEKRRSTRSLNAKRRFPVTVLESTAVEMVSEVFGGIVGGVCCEKICEAITALPSAGSDDIKYVTCDAAAFAVVDRWDSIVTQSIIKGLQQSISWAVQSSDGGITAQQYQQLVSSLSLSWAGEESVVRRIFRCSERVKQTVVIDAILFLAATRTQLQGIKQLIAALDGLQQDAVVAGEPCNTMSL